MKRRRRRRRRRNYQTNLRPPWCQWPWEIAQQKQESMNTFHCHTCVIRTNKNRRSRRVGKKNKEKRSNFMKYSVPHSTEYTLLWVRLTKIKIENKNWKIEKKTFQKSLFRLYRMKKTYIPFTSCVPPVLVFVKFHHKFSFKFSKFQPVTVVFKEVPFRHKFNDASLHRAMPPPGSNMFKVLWSQ